MSEPTCEIKLKIKCWLNCLVIKESYMHFCRWGQTVYTWKTIFNNIRWIEAVQVSVTCKYLFSPDSIAALNPGRRPKWKSTSLPPRAACANFWWILTVTSWVTLEDTRMLSSENKIIHSCAKESSFLHLLLSIASV